MHNKKLNKNIITGLVTVSLLTPMVLKNLSADASDNKTSHIRQSLVKDNSFQDFTNSSGININPSQLNDDDINRMANELSSYTDAYQSIINNVNNDKASRLKSLMHNQDGRSLSNNIDNETVMKYADQLNRLASAVHDAASQSNQEAIQGNIQDRANAIRNIFQQHHTSTVALNGQSYDVYNMSDDNVIDLGNKLDNFTYVYSNILSDNSTQQSQVDALHSRLKNSDESNLLNKNNNDIIQMGKDVNNLALDVRNNTPGELLASQIEIHAAGSIKKALNDNNAKNIPVIAYSDGLATILNPTNMSDEDTASAQGSLDIFASEYQEIQNNSISQQSNQLKTLIMQIINSDVTNKDDTTVIKLGADLNEVAKNIQNNKANDDKHNNDSDQSNEDKNHGNNDNQHNNSQSSGANGSTSVNNVFSGSSSLNASSSNHSSNSSNSNYDTPKINDASNDTNFPNAPKIENYETNKNIHKNKNVSAKQLKQNKANVKKQQKHLKNIKKELKEIKNQSKKAKLNKQLKQAKELLTKSKMQLTNSKNATK